jgi:hypothetical protein
MIATKTILIAGGITLGTATAGGVTYATVSSSTPATPAVAQALPSKVASAKSALPSVPAVPSGLPTDAAKKLPSQVPTSVPTTLPTDKVPALPKLDCSSLPAAAPASATGGGALGLPGGLTFSGSKSVTYTVDGQKICSTVQTWKGKGGQWVQAQRLKGAATLEQIRQALKLPQLSPATVNGSAAWQSPLGSQANGYIFWSSGPGQAEVVAASPVYTLQLSDIAAKIRKLG